MINYNQFKQHLMAQNEVANSSLYFRAQKSSFQVQMKIKNDSGNPILIITIRNTKTNVVFLLEMDDIEIQRDKVLQKYFANAENLYHELVNGFQQIKIEDNKKYILIKYEFKMGTFRKQLLVLQLKPQSQHHKQKQKVPVSPSNPKKKIIIDKSYTRDFILFKDDFIKICERIASKEVLGRLNIKNDRNSRIKIKNMFISFANTILKSYRKYTEFADIEITQEECFTQPANKLLAQKNELLENILLKAMKRIRETPTQQIEVDFMPEIPTDLLVVMQKGEQIRLEQYLTSFPMDQIRSRIKFNQKRREKLTKALNLINQQKKQKGDQMVKLLERDESEKRNTRVLFTTKANAAENSEFDEF